MYKARGKLVEFKCCRLINSGLSGSKAECGVKECFINKLDFSVRDHEL